MTDDKRCGTCGWAKTNDTIEASIPPTYPCEVPLPAWFSETAGECGQSWVSDYDGAGCLCWKRREEATPCEPE